jgi:uncharacterized phage protein (TIGR01671 family)
MREVLFRGKRTDNDEWIEGALLYTVSWTGAVTDARIVEDYLDDDIPQLFQHEVEPSTVGQYTGLHDKNGKEIYEGDIVRTKDGDIKKIIYKDYWGAFGVEYGLLFDKESGKHVKAHGGLSHFYGDSQFYEVIGNIHDNPELLEESK